MSENSSTSPSEETPDKRSVSFALGGTSWIIASWAIASIIVLPGLLFAPAYLFQLSIQDIINTQDIVVIILLSFAYAPITVLIIWAGFRPFLKRLGLSTKQLIGLARRPRIRDVLIALPAYLIYFAITILAFSVVSYLFPSTPLDQAQNLGISDPKTALQYVLTFVMLVILPPFIEEVLFRGYLYGTLRRGFPAILAALVTSTLFGLAHGQLNLFIDTFILGMMLSYLREKPALFGQA